MAARTRRVIWAESARDALEEVLGYISRESPDRAGRVLTRALDVAASLSTLSERGRVVPEIGESTLRELLVYDHRMLYRVHEDRVVIRAFLHGAREIPQRSRSERV